MPFKPKPVVTAGKGEWAVRIPRPPKHATHARMVCHNQLTDKGKAKVATLPIQDFGCFRGVIGEFTFLRMDNKKTLKEEYKGSWEWDGTEVIGIDDLTSD